MTLLLRFILAAGLAFPATAGHEAVLGKTYKAEAAAAKSAIAASNWEIHKSIQIDPGKTATIDADMDFTTADRVLVSVRSTADTDGYLSGLALTAAWSHPDVDYYSVIEEVKGKSFPYWNTGGAVFQVFGPQFRLILQNSGTQIINIQQIVIGRR